MELHLHLHSRGEERKDRIKTGKYDAWVDIEQVEVTEDTLGGDSGCEERRVSKVLLVNLSLWLLV